MLCMYLCYYVSLSQKMFQIQIKIMGVLREGKSKKEYLFITDDTDDLKIIQNGFYFNKRPPLIPIICKAFSQEPFSQKNLLSSNKHR